MSKVWKLLITLPFLTAFSNVYAQTQAPIPSADTWTNWSQSSAFDDAQKRLKQGKDPMPGPRTCFWRYGPAGG